MTDNWMYIKGIFTTGHFTHTDRQSKLYCSLLSRLNPSPYTPSSTKVLKIGKEERFGLWADYIIPWATTPPHPITFNNEGEVPGEVLGPKWDH